MQSFLHTELSHRGNSKGFLYKIRRDGETRGYLFATLHNLTSKERSAIWIAKQILNKLGKCCGLGIETNDFEEDPSYSVEDRLIDFCKDHAIVHFGMDSPVRHSFGKDISDRMAQLDLSESEAQSLLREEFQMDNTWRFYQDGDLEGYRQAAAKLSK